MAITAFVNILPDGQCDNDVSHILFEAKLVALNKKASDVRSLRRLVAKYTARYACEKLLACKHAGTPLIDT